MTRSLIGLIRWRDLRSKAVIPYGRAEARAGPYADLRPAGGPVPLSRPEVCMWASKHFSASGWDNFWLKSRFVEYS